MFKKWEPEEKEEEKTFTKEIVSDEKADTVNTILKGSKLTGRYRYNVRFRIEW